MGKNGHNLSSIEVVLLSIVNEKPAYAYEIDKIIELREMRRWIRVGVASIYQVLKKLEQKKLVYSQSEKEGRMPERKRYYITGPGRTALLAAAQRLLSEMEWHYLDLNVGLEASDLLTPAEIAGCIKRRLVKVRTNKKKLEEVLAADSVTTFKRTAVVKNLIYFRDAEEKYLRELLEYLHVEHKST